MSPFPRHEGVSIERQVEVDVFPALIEERGSKIVGGLAMFFGLSFGGLPVVALVVALVEEGWSRDILTALLYALPIVALFGWMTLYGVDQWMQRTRVELDGHEVRWERRRLRGTGRHSERLSSFSGIRADRWTDSDVGDRWELWLQHPTPDLSILLYRANRETGRTDRWRRYCEVFGVPPIESLGLGGTVVRPMDDWDRPFAALARHGRAVVPDPGPAPADVAVVEHADETVLRLPGNPDLTIGPRHIVLPGTAIRETGTTVAFADVVSATVEREPATFRGHVLLLHYRKALPDGTPINLSATLARKLPVPTLVWAQRFVLQAVAVSGEP
jgi:hypothetical protein